jgi:uncharacterized membrane protein
MPQRSSQRFGETGMTTGQLIVNIVMVVVATILVAGPAVLVPMLLDREHRAEAAAEAWLTGSVETVSVPEAAPALATV